MTENTTEAPANAPEGNTPATGSEFSPITSQADLDRVVGERLARERAKYADYTTLKEKAAKYDAAEEASKSELEKALARAERAEQEATELKTKAQVAEWRTQVASDLGVPAEALRGSTLEELTEHGEQLKQVIGSAKRAQGGFLPREGETDSSQMALNGAGIEAALIQAVGANR